MEGGIKARKVKIDALSWPDYVFDQQYVLIPISEVAQFIEQHHHLPGVPSAAEVQKNGLDLGDNQATLLKKIEELTLYLIAQNKKLEMREKLLQQLTTEKQRTDRLEKEIQALKSRAVIPKK